MGKKSEFEKKVKKANCVKKKILKKIKRIIITLFLNQLCPLSLDQLI